MFIFSPLVSRERQGQQAVTSDVLLQVSLDGHTSRIRTGPEAFKDETFLTIPEGAQVPDASPGYLVIIGNKIWTSGYIQRRMPDISEPQLRRLEFGSFLPSEVTLLSGGQSDDSYRPGEALMSNSQGQLFGVSGCDIYRLNSFPYARVFKGATDPNVSCGQTPFQYLTAGPSETFYEATMGATSFFSDAAKTNYKEVFYQIFRIRDGHSESWAGSSEKGFKDGQGKDARFAYPLGLVAARDGSVYVADAENHAVRKVSPTGDVSTVAGNGTAGKADGTPESAQFDYPTDVLLGPCHKLYVFDNNGIREIALPPEPASERWEEPVSKSYEK